MSAGSEYRYVGDRSLLDEPMLEPGGEQLGFGVADEEFLPGGGKGGEETGFEVVSRRKSWPGVAEAAKVVADAARAGDFAGTMAGRVDLIRALYLRGGAMAGRVPVEEEAKVKAVIKGGKVSGEPPAVPLGGVRGWQPLAEGDLECTEVAGDVLGYTGEEYRGRKVVAFRKHPEVFGGVPMRRAVTVRLTLHKGILNHMELRSGKGVPTPYWAVMDAASDLKSGFTTEQVLIRALGILGDDSRLDACRIAWYVLKSHHTHPKERYRGMSYMVDEAADGTVGIRGRKAGEAVVGGAPVARVERDAPLAGAVMGKEVEVPIVTHVVSKVR